MPMGAAKELIQITSEKGILVTWQANVNLKLQTYLIIK